MAVMQAYNAGLDELRDWTSDTYHWMLLTSGSFDSDHATVSAVLAGGAEATVTNYSRQAASTKTRTVDHTNNRVTYEADDPSFVALGSGETVTAIVLLKLVTNDADSPPIAWWTLDTSVPTDFSDPLSFILGDGYLAYVDEA